MTFPDTLLLPSPQGLIADQRFKQRRGEWWVPGRENSVRGLCMRMRKHLCLVMSLATGSSAHMEDSSSLTTAGRTVSILSELCVKVHQTQARTFSMETMQTSY